jgi:hypothetical protein
MAPILIGCLALILILVLLRAFAFADTKTLVKSLRYFGVALLGAFAVLFAFRGGLAPAMFLGSMAWGLATGGRVWPGGWPHYSGGSGSAPGSGQTSSVRTPWVEMALNHDTGEMRGNVLKGAHAGKSLDSLGRAELLAFYREAGSADAETARLLEAYLDRTLGGDWRTDAEHERAAAHSGSGMSRAEALKVLGLQDGANEEQIRAAHRRLMMQNHPDRGGSDYIAAKINEAKDVLLG